MQLPAREYPPVTFRMARFEPRIFTVGFENASYATGATDRCVLPYNSSKYQHVLIYIVEIARNGRYGSGGG